ncbi:unnamed protein product [Brachionus calyciflorus]|uniref:Cystatin domain-containing protein n=1 Tax=Brachionus calyciflorus TaxID=104777 RepID=A0A814BAI6_9BILA|nr:unnamed protein product [Brachionus calyciflorus]
MMTCGGLGQAQPVNEDIHDLVKQVKSQLATHAPGHENQDLEPISFRSQIVNGVNYFIKCKSGDQHVHLKVHKPLPHTQEGPTLTGVQTGKSDQDEVAFF